MRKIKLAVFDWAGTTVDYGCVAPLAVFEKIFENKNIHLTREEILKPMGMGKRDHIETLLRTENATEQWKKQYNRDWNQADVDEMFAQFNQQLLAVLENYATPIDGVLETIQQLRKADIFIGSTTGYTREMMDIVEEKAKEAASGLVDKIQETIESLPSKMLDAGKNLVEGLWNGITSAGSWLKEKISGFADGIISDFKSAFGIHSPSTLMRDLIGKNLAEGIGVGFTEEMPDIGVDAVKAMKQLEFEIDSDAPRISVEADIPEIDDSAIAALDLHGSPSDPAIARPSATSEVINNSYNYSTVHNNGTDGNPQPVQINAQFIVGEEVVAKGVVDVAADGIDERQGVTVKMKKRGLAT